jgi:hypothetical protein
MVWWWIDQGERCGHLWSRLEWYREKPGNGLLRTLTTRTGAFVFEAWHRTILARPTARRGDPDPRERERVDPRDVFMEHVTQRVLAVKAGCCV